jgi:hypothetical protein
MSILIAIGHILGAFVGLIMFGLAVLALAAWEAEKIRKTALEELSVEIGIPVSDLEKPEHQPALLRFLSSRFSSELLRNRLSDLCGWIRLGWGWIGLLCQAALFLWVIYLTVTDDLSNSVSAWWVIAVALFFWITSAVFALVCKLLTGRFPGQAREARKSLAAAVANQHASSANQQA